MITKSYRLSSILAGLILGLYGQLPAQTFKLLHSFAALDNSTNSDGANPGGRLIFAGSTLYGTAGSGGSSTNGTVFSVNTDGNGFRTLYTFTGGGDGALPQGIGALALAGDTLYGTTLWGGNSSPGYSSFGAGTVYAVKIDGSGFRTLHSFTPTNASLEETNADGIGPKGELLLLGDTLYGNASAGGSGGNGTVFSLNTDGTGFKVLHSFALQNHSGPPWTNTDGENPGTGLVISGNALYGATAWGGSGGSGTIFSISFQPRLTISPSGANVILTWPTNYAGFDYTGYQLQSTTNLGPAAIWTTNSPAPVAVNGQYTVTNPISGAQQFFRLRQ